jgi:hypothetical protein
VGTGGGKHWGKGGMSEVTVEKKMKKDRYRTEQNRMTFVPTMCRFPQTLI